MFIMTCSVRRGSKVSEGQEGPGAGEAGGSDPLGKGLTCHADDVGARHLCDRDLALVGSIEVHVVRTDAGRHAELELGRARLFEQLSGEVAGVEGSGDETEQRDRRVSTTRRDGGSRRRQGRLPHMSVSLSSFWKALSGPSLSDVTTSSCPPCLNQSSRPSWRGGKK